MYLIIADVKDRIGRLLLTNMFLKIILRADTHPHTGVFNVIIINHQENKQAIPKSPSSFTHNATTDDRKQRQEHILRDDDGGRNRDTLPSVGALVLHTKFGQGSDRYEQETY